MATPEAATQARPARMSDQRPGDHPKAVAKSAASRKTRKPSFAPVFLIMIVGAICVHLLFCLALANLGDKVEWHPFALMADVWFGENQFIINPILSFFPFDILFGFAFAVVVGFIIRLPFFRDRVYHTVIDLKKRLMLQLSASAEEVESILRNDPENNARLLARRDDINLNSVHAEISAVNAAQTYLTGKGSWLSGMATYMRFHFTEEYSNTVTGMAYGGAAFLIFVVGIRGLKFISAARLIRALRAGRRVYDARVAGNDNDFHRRRRTHRQDFEANGRCRQRRTEAQSSRTGTGACAPAYPRRLRADGP